MYYKSMMEMLEYFIVNKLSVLLLFVTVLLFGTGSSGTRATPSPTAAGSVAPQATITTAKTAVSHSKCVDEVPDCDAYLKDKGDSADFCTGKFRLYSSVFCRKTCGHCNDTCVDEHPNCTHYTFDDICIENITWSLVNCQKYCGFCGGSCSAFCSPPPTNRTDSCDVTTGDCLYGCRHGFAGRNCSFECSQNCENNTNSREVCNATSGECLFGCKSGFAGPNCTVPCSNFDRSCKACHQDTDDSGFVCTECNKNFYRFNGKCVICNYWCQWNDSGTAETCRERDGFCEFGCKAGRYGFNCGMRCSSVCKNECHRNNDIMDTVITVAKLDGMVTRVTDNAMTIASVKPATEETGHVCPVVRPDGMVNTVHKNVVEDAQIECALLIMETAVKGALRDFKVRSVTKICFLESHLLGHARNFRSGCMDEKTCHSVERANTSSVCVECCNTDMCNNRGCGNTDFPSREQRGPVCFDCHHTGNPNTCETVTMCTSNQVCSIERFQWGDNFHYKQGCAHPVCNSLSRRRRSVPTCHTCCNTDYCNLNCTSNTVGNGEIFVG